jgi:tripartite-type tricarboxylate transporter receptor subunit TctC
MIGRRTILAGAFAAAGTSSALANAGDAYPNRPVMIVVPFPAGGGTDLSARNVAERLTAAFGQQFLVDNKSGASGNIGTAAVARAPADGYTLLMGTSGTQAVNAYLYEHTGYDGVKDFAPISLAVRIPNLIVVHPDLPAKTLAEFIAYAKANPGLYYGHTSVGGSKHLAAEVFCQKAGIKLSQVPYKGSAPMMADLLGGHIKVAFDEVLTSMPFVQSGKLRAIAITGPVRWPTLPDVPKVAEYGGPLADYAVTGWYGLLAPAATPPEIVSRLSEQVMKAFADKDFRQRMYSQGVEPVGDSPEQFRAFIVAENERWGAVIRQLGLKVE